MDVPTYAAAVSTLALVISVVTAAVQVRKAFTDGVRLRLSVISEATFFGVPGYDEEDTFIAVTVTNIGSSSTTITHMMLYEYENPVIWTRARPIWTAFVTTPNIPYLLKPGEMWHGHARYNDALVERLHRKSLKVGVVGSHRARPYLASVDAPRA